MSARVLLFAQHLLGIGHYVRSIRIADALGEAGFEVILVSGGMPVQHPRPRTAQIEQLEPFRAADGDFSGYVDQHGNPITDALVDRRVAKLAAIYDKFEPQVVVTEAFPFGRRILRRELLPLLETARRRATVTTCSLRDILVKRRPKREDETVGVVQDFYDLVLVHGDPSVIRLDETFGPAGAIAGKVHYTGYVAPTGGPASTAPNNEVLVSAGGGFVGHRLLQLALEAKDRTTLAGLTWRLIAGQGLPEPEFRDLVERAPAGVVIDRELPDLADRLRRCRLSVSQAGYNTMVEVLSAGVSAVCMPFATATETEQSLRCERLRQRGLIEVVSPTGSATELAAAIDRAAQRRDTGQAAIDLGGAEATARLVQAALSR